LKTLDQNTYLKLTEYHFIGKCIGLLGNAFTKLKEMGCNFGSIRSI
jgi:hypothetical protein